MWAALALTTVLNVAPAQLELKNVRTTYGILGQERKDDEFLPGDVVVVAFDVEGLKVKPDGRVQYAMGMELTKKGKNKPEFKHEPDDREAMNSLGGSTLPMFVNSVIGTDTAPGEYVLKVTVRDRQVKGSEKVLEKAFKVKKPDLGFVRVRFLSFRGDPVPPIAVAGQRIDLNFMLVGIESGKDKLPHVSFEMQVLDSAGKSVLEKPFKGDLRDDVTKTLGQMTFVPIPLELNRPGKFKVMLKATDNISKKKTELALDLDVLSGLGGR
jgi:hypothetical protein